MRIAYLFMTFGFFAWAGILAADDSKLLFDLSVKDGRIAAGPAECQVNVKAGKNAIMGKSQNKEVIQLNCDGSKNEYIQVYSKKIKNEGKPLDRAFTVEAKFKPVDIFEDQQLVHKLVLWSNSGYSAGAFSVGFKDAVPYVAIWTLNNNLKEDRKLVVCRGGQLVPDSWNFVAAVFDGKKIVFYVNGQKCAEEAVPEGVFPYSEYDQAGSFIIGNGCYLGMASFSGLIERVRVRNEAATDFFIDAGQAKMLESNRPELNRDEALFKFENIIGCLPARPGSYVTSLKDTFIVSPADEKLLVLARKIADKLNIGLIKADDAVKGRCRGLTDKCLNSNLILLGNINNNAAIIPLYARFLSWADADYPGKGGYAIRTIRNPYGSFKNNILLESSDYSGLEKAVDAFLKAPQLDAISGKCDYIFDIKPVLPEKTAVEMAKLVNKISPFINGGAIDDTGVQIGQFAVAYYLTGQKQFETPLKVYAEKVTKKIFPAFVVGHYFWENLVRALEIITNTNVVDAETVRKLDINLFLSLHNMQDDYGIRRNQQPPGGRHQIPPTCAYMMFCDLLRRNLSQKTSLNIKTFVDTNYNSTANFFRYLNTCTFSCEDDSSSTAATMTSLMQAAFTIGDMTLFESGLAMEGAKKMICTVDNRGYGAGAGIYEDSYEAGMTKKPYSNGGPVCYAAFYYHDPELEWIKQNIKGMSFDSWFAQTWFGLHKYATGDYLKAVKPDSKYLSTFCHSRPITLNNYHGAEAFPKDMLFDKAVIRSGTTPDDAYICFQGDGSGKEGLWDSASDTMVLLRYADKGELWLANNTQLNGLAWRNSFIVSDGSADSVGCYPFARLDFLGKADGYDAFSGSVNNVRNGIWTRRAVYLGDGRLFVADTFQAGKPGEYSFLQTFKTPVPAELSGDKIIATKAGLKMIAAGTGKGVLSMDNGVERMEPQRFWYFRRSYDKKMNAGEKVTLSTMFRISSFSDRGTVTLVEETPESFYYLGDNCKTIRISFDSNKFRIKEVPSCPVDIKKTIEPQQQLFGIKKIVEINNNFALIPEEIRGWKVVSPALANAHVLDDNIVKRWDEGCGYDGKSPLIIDLMRPVNLGGLSFCNYTFEHKGQPKVAPDVNVVIEAADNPGFNNAAKQNVILKHSPDMRELYKMDAWQVERYLGQTVFKNIRYLKISGLPERLSEMSLYSDKDVPAGIKRMKAADLDGDGIKELLVETFDRRITAFNRQGQKLFDIKVPFEIIDFVAEDMDGDHKAEIIFPCFDLRLYKYDWQGRQIKISEPLFQHPYTVNVLKNKNTGAKKLAVTYYYHHQFFDANLEPLLQPVGFGAMWTENVQPMDINGDGMEDMVISDIYGRAYTIDGQTGKVSKLFWAVDGIFNGIFSAGKPQRGKQAVIFAGTGKISCSQIGIGDSVESVPQWNVSDESQFSAAALIGNTLFSSRFAGHVMTMSASGKINNIWWPQGRIFALAEMSADVAVATDSGLKFYDGSRKLSGFYPGIVTQLIADNSLLWAVVDNKIVLLSR